jgi:hypothetical protein
VARISIYSCAPAVLLAYAIAPASLSRADTPAAPALVTANIYNAPLPSETLHNDRDNIVIGVHGWTSYPGLWWRDGSNSWNEPGMASALTTALGANASNWDVWGLDWTEGAAGTGGYPSTTNEINAQLQGQYIAKEVISGNYKFVHLMGHSLGARVIETAANIIKQVRPSITVQTTFFDAYQPYQWGLVFGSSADYADQYYTTLDVFSGNLTAGKFPNALNVNMDAFVQPRPADYNFSTDNTLNDEYWQHNSPHFWYKATVQAPNNASYGGFGFALSKESGNAWPPKNPKYAVGQDLTLNADGSISAQATLPKVSTVAANAVSVKIQTSGITGSANTITDPVANTVIINAYDSTTATPVGYVNFTLHLAKPVNYFQFNYKWLDLIDGDGRLTFNVYHAGTGFFDPEYTQLLWATDSVNGFDATTLSTGKIIWTGSNGASLAAGDYELRFRLDDLDGTQTSIQIGDIQAGLLVVPEPSSLFLIAVGAIVLWQRDRRTMPLEKMGEAVR